MSMVRWGLLSTANINKKLIPAIRASRRGELIAVASRDIQNALDYASKWEIPKAFGDYQEMLESGDIDCVYISLPNHLHAEWSIKAIQAGVHVLCEKPFATSLEQVEAMIKSSQETGINLAEAFMYRHHPQTKIVGEFIHSGKLGKISIVRGVFNFFMSQTRRDPQKPDVRLVPDYGGGALWDIGVYPISFSQYIMMDKPQRVFGTQWVSESGVDETFAGQVSYRGDRIAQIACSFRTPFYTRLEIQGTKGQLVIETPFVFDQEPGAVFYTTKEGATKIITIPQKELYLGEVEDMNAAILDGKPNYISLDETRNHVRTVLALYKSAKINKPVNL